MALCALSVPAVASDAYSDDTELFIYDFSKAGDYRPKVLVIFDNSGSMDTVAQRKPAYDNTQTYPTVPGIVAKHTGREPFDAPAALREAVAQCTACSLCQSRRQTVFGVGHPSAHWLIVGEAPGEQEDRQGEPFVGPAGQLLDAMLRATGRDRGTDLAGGVFIANVLKCRPPANRNPAPEEVQRCEPFLARQVALVQPKLIIAMGRFAVQSLLRTTEPIGKLRGRVHRYEGVPVIVTYHPAYLLRNPADKAKAWADLCLALDQPMD
mgnify:CR=1 FL=1